MILLYVIFFVYILILHQIYSFITHSILYIQLGHFYGKSIKIHKFGLYWDLSDFLDYEY